MSADDVPRPIDIFGDAATPRVVGAPIPRWQRTVRPRAGGRVIAAAGLAAAGLGYAFDLRNLVLVVFVLGVAETYALRPYRKAQCVLGTAVAATFFTYGLPLILTPFALHIRFVFYAVIVGSTVALYEWLMP